MVINESSGNGSDDPGQVEKRIREMFARHDIDAAVHCVSAGDIADLTEAALQQKVDGIVVGGGDGTVSTVAHILADAEGAPPLGVLPFGTLNHFAKDLHMPMDVEDAVGVIAAMQVATVDVGEVNGKIFINNSSIGGYPQTVLGRDWQRKRLGRSKWPAMVISVFHFLKRFRVMRVRVILDGDEVYRRTPFVFVGNNDYELDKPPLGMRDKLDTGRLCLYTANCHSGLELLKLGWLMLRNRLQDAPEFQAHQVAEAWIHTDKKHIYVAKDGEVIRLETPLHYRSRGAALRVFVPPLKSD